MRICLACLLVVISGSDQTAKNWKDRAEYGLYEKVASEYNNGEKLKLLLEWKRLYPDSDFRQERLTLLVLAYENEGRAEAAFAAARELLGGEPGNLLALRALCQSAPQLKDPPAEAAGIVKKAATELLSRLDESFPEQTTRRNLNSMFDSVETAKPARTEQIPNPNRKDQRAEVERIARQALAWANSTEPR
jgi:hypothetical protein